MMKKLTALVAAVVFAVSGCSDAARTDNAQTSNVSENTETRETYTTDLGYGIRTASFSFAAPTPEPSPAEVTYTALDMNALRDMIQTELNSADGTWSVYIKDMNGNKEILINDAPMKAASVMKLFVMGAAFDNIKTGLFEYGDIREDMYYMITESSNESANAILYALGRGSYAAGIDKVNAFTDKYGYNEKTVEYNGFDNPDTIVGGSFNVTSAHDCGMMLDAIYNGRCVSAEMSKEMLELLKAQQTDYKLAYTLPKDIVIANKSGEMDSVENDVGIVYSPERDYIICVLSNDWADNADAIEKIQDISQTAYDFFNPDNTGYELVKVSESGGSEDTELVEVIEGGSEETENTEVMVGGSEETELVEVTEGGSEDTELVEVIEGGSE